jgi:hypothetical protein
MIDAGSVLLPAQFFVSFHQAHCFAKTGSCGLRANKPDIMTHTYTITGWELLK